MLLAGCAANMALALVFQGSVSARKKFESTFFRYPASPSSSHSRSNAYSASLTCFSSVCFAQSNKMLVSFFASSDQKADTIALHVLFMRGLFSPGSTV